MGTWSRAVICLTFLLTTTAVIIPGITDPTFITNCTREHNQHRSNVQPQASNMRYMSWDEGLAVTASSWARRCLFKHNTHLKEKGKVHQVFTSVGENLWAGTAFSVKSAIKDWFDEVQYYTYKTMNCREVCGHYTQVVWADSYKVGCAVHFCPKGIEKTTFFPRPAAIFVCNYAPAGNYFGQRPYLTGSPCSGCVGEKCEMNLCRNSTRDTLRGTSWDPTLCAAVLITRPVILLFIFSSVYCIQLYYPNIFVYTS